MVCSLLTVQCMCILTLHRAQIFMRVLPPNVLDVVRTAYGLLALLRPRRAVAARRIVVQRDPAAIAGWLTACTRGTAARSCAARSIRPRSLYPVPRAPQRLSTPKCQRSQPQSARMTSFSLVQGLPSTALWANEWWGN